MRNKATTGSHGRAARRRLATTAALTAALAGAAVTAVAAPANAYCRSTTCVGDCARDINGCKTQGNPLFWPGLCVSFSLNVDGSQHMSFEEFERIAEASVAAWSDINCGDGTDAYATISFVRKDDVDCHKAEYDQGGGNANVILFQDTKWAYTGIDNTLAKTTVTYDTDTGEILDADIEMNHAYNEFTTGDDNIVYDLQSILTHEIGHFLGLDHTDDFSATMNPGYQEGTSELRSIEPDDEGGVCAAYPADRNVTCRPEPNGGFTKVCADDDPPPEEDSCSVASASISDATSNRQSTWLAAIVLAGAVAMRRRKSRK